MTTSVAVCTLVRGRLDHLRNVVRGLTDQTRPPDRVVVAVMGGPDPSPVLSGSGLPVEVVDAQDPRSELPLARARNLAWSAARSDVTVMLDVDVIPDRTLVADYVERVEQHDAVWSGRVDYLPPLDLGGPHDAQAPLDRDLLARAGAPHPARRPPEEDTLLPSPELFWSLSFALSASCWWRIGGFDESYRGYGGEDTDFALRAEAAGVALRWTGAARGWHQHHESTSPPTTHLHDIVANARRFRQVWGRWPMEGWLRDFADMGLVEWDPAGTTLRVTARALTG